MPNCQVSLSSMALFPSGLLEETQLRRDLNGGCCSGPAGLGGAGMPWARMRRGISLRHRQQSADLAGIVAQVGGWVTDWWGALWVLNIADFHLLAVLSLHKYPSYLMEDDALRVCTQDLYHIHKKLLLYLCVVLFLLWLCAYLGPFGTVIQFPYTVSSFRVSKGTRRMSNQPPWDFLCHRGTEQADLNIMPNLYQ